MNPILISALLFAKQQPQTPPAQTPTTAPAQAPATQTPVTPPIQTAPTGPVLTLDDAVALGLKNAFSVQTAASQLRQTQDLFDEARASLGPRVVAGATYTRFDKEITSNAGGGGGSGVIQPLDEKQATAELSMPIDITGILGQGIRGAANEVRASAENLVATQNQVALNVRTAYYSVLRANALVGVAQQEVTSAQQAVTTEQQQLQAGVVAQVDVLRLQAQLSQAQSDLITAQTGMAIAKENLNNTLGRAIETPFDVQDPTTLPTVTLDADTLAKAGVARRPEILAIKYQRIALHWLTREQQGGLLPSLNLSANYNRNIDPPAGTRDYTAFATLALSWPIFDSGLTHARVKDAQENENQAAIDESQLELGVSLQVRQAVTDLVNAKATMDVAQSQVTAAAETYRLAQVRLQAGEGTSLEVSTALTALVQAQQGLTNARYDYLTAYAQLQQAVASDDPNAVGTEQGTSGK